MEKPMKACDADLSKIKYPVCVLPKIDGVRVLCDGLNALGRSLKKHRNKHTQKILGVHEFFGIDGEMTLGWYQSAPDLCRMTSSAVSTIEGEPNIILNAFDIWSPYVAEDGYAKRYVRLQQ